MGSKYVMHNATRHRSKKLLFVLFAVVLVGGVIAGYMLLRKDTPQNLVIPSQETNSPETVEPEKQPEKPSDKSVAGNKENQTSSTPTTLLVPSGTFVSNHRPSLGASPKRISVESVCSTTSGAKCYIQFTKGTLTRTLPAKTADANGAVFWTWNAKDAKLTVGTWKIKAVAELNGQTKTTTDSINLEVQP